MSDDTGKSDETDFCKLLLQISKEIWTELQLVADGESAIPAALDEEGITSDLVRRLARRFSPSSRVIENVRTFSKAEEAIRGADWEFMLRRNGRHVLLRFQAKRIYYSNNRPAYRFEDSTKVKLTEQPARLIAFARLDRATPMYMFYNFFRPKMINFGVQCHSDFRLPQNVFGISVCHAEIVLAKLEKQRGRLHYLDEERSLAGNSCAMSCLFCRRKEEFPDPALDPVVTSMFNPKILNNFAENGVAPSLERGELPSHVLAVLDHMEKHPSDENFAFPTTFGGVRGLILLDYPQAGSSSQTSSTLH